MASVVEHTFTGSTTPYTSYDSTKTNLGVLFTQHTGSLATDKWAGPLPIAYLRIREMPTDFAPQYPHALTISDTIDWIFVAEASTASDTRKIGFIEYNKITQTMTWKGFIITSWLGWNQTITGFRAIRHLYTTGTASTNGTTVTGVDTGWKTARYASGARIGFGSTDPTLITTWYYITDIGDDTTITLDKSAGTIPNGPFVIEELRFLISTTSADVTTWGLTLLKGFNADDFSATGRLISYFYSGDIDNRKSMYHLISAWAPDLSAACGFGLDTGTDLSQFVYVLNRPTTTTAQFFKFDIRAELTSLSNGHTPEAFVCKTGISPTLTVMPAFNNSRLGTLNHHPVNGEKSIFFCGTARIYRALPSRIYDGSVNFIADDAVEVPMGWAITNALLGTASVEIANTIDRLVVGGSIASYTRSYVTKYQTESQPFENMWGVYTNQLDGNGARLNETTPYASNIAILYTYVENGIAYIVKGGGTTNWTLMAMPFGAHWDYAGTAPVQRLITPALETPYATSLTRLYVNYVRILGSDTLGTPPEPWRVYARTSGIIDDSGTWTRINAGDLSSLTTSTQIQIMFEFRILGTSCIPARIHSVAITYEEPQTDIHFQPSIKFSTFAWRYATAFGTTVPPLRIRMYDTTTQELLVDDNTTTPTGTFEKSTDGISWTTWNNTDRSNETTYIKYTYRPGDAFVNKSAKVKAVLSIY